MAKLALSSWRSPKPSFQFLFVFKLYIHKCFVLLWDTQLLPLPSATALPRSAAGPPLHRCLQPPGAARLQRGGSSSPPTPSPSSQSAEAAGAAAVQPPLLFRVFTSLLPTNVISSWARTNYHTNDFGQCQQFHYAVLLL